MLRPQIKNLTIFLRCFFASRPPANLVPVQTTRIVIIQLAQMGDMACTTPVFRAIKKKFPNSSITVIGTSHNKDLLAGNKDVDGYIAYTKDFNQTVEEIRRGNFDFGCVTTPSFAALALIYLGRVGSIVAPHVIGGINPQQTKLYLLLKRKVLSVTYVMGEYVPAEMLKLLKPLGIEDVDTTKHLSFSLESKNKVEVFFNENHIGPKDVVIGISPSSGNKIKNWGSNNFARLADYIWNNYQSRIIIIGSAVDRAEVEEMVDSLDPDTKFINAAEHFSVEGLKALVARLDMFIGVDTGPIYIAEAFGVATIDIVGPVDEREQPPQGRIHKIVKWKDRGAPAIHILNARMYDAVKAREQIDKISVQDVIDSFRDLYPIVLSDHSCKLGKTDENAIQ